MTQWQNQRCVPCEGGAQALDATAVASALKDLPGWSSDDKATEIHRRLISRTTTKPWLSLTPSLGCRTNKTIILISKLVTIAATFAIRRTL